jgi:hypothetical protein
MFMYMYTDVSVVKDTEDYDVYRYVYEYMYVCI